MDALDVLAPHDVLERISLYGEHTYAAHRADLLDALRSALAERSIHLGKRCVAVESRGPSRPPH